MKKVLLSVIFVFFFTVLSFASSGVVKPVAKKQPIKTEITRQVIKGDSMSAADIEKVEQDVRNSADWFCILIIWEDGSWLEVCCEKPCMIGPIIFDPY